MKTETNVQMKKKKKLAIDKSQRLEYECMKNI